MRIVLFANTEWYLYNFRLSLAGALREEGHQLLLVSPPGPYGQRLRELGFDWRPLPMSRRSLNPVAELRLIHHLAVLFRAEGIELVHGFTIKSAVYGSLAARWAGVARRINAVAGMGYVFSSRDLKARLLRPVVRLAIRLAFAGEYARLIVQNPTDAQLFRDDSLVAEEHIRLIMGSGVDCARFSPATDEPRGSDSPKVLLTARLLWDKGLAEYIGAIRLLRQRGVRARFLLAGEPDEGNPAAVPSAALSAWQAEGLVEWLGHVEDMPELLRSVDLVVLPSYREGLSKALIEAAACGRPLVATNVPGCREVVEDGATGLLVEPQDCAALAAAIGRLLDDAELRLRMGRRGRAKVLAEFDQRIINGQTLEVYRELFQR